MTTAYPLSWPPHMPRSAKREKGQFRTKLATALVNVRNSLHLFGRDSDEPIANLVISSNVTLGDNSPADPGVAIWFQWQGMQVCIPVDRYSSVEGNLQAIHHIIEARRVEIRHGTLALVRATFSGFVALPAPAKRSCWEVLGLTEPSKAYSKQDIEAAYRRLSKERHPDAPGGSHDLMAELNAAREEALRRLS